MPPAEQEIRCFCSRHPLLGIFGKDRNGAWFVHIKIFKQGKVFGEIIAHDGTVSVRCRECLRWHRIILRRTEFEVKQKDLPDAVVL